MKRLALLLSGLGLMCGCGSPTPADHAPKSTITGKISGHGNQAPALARVDLFEPDSAAPRRFQAAADGSFTVTTAQTGFMRLNFTGSLHNSYPISLWLPKPTQINLAVRLTPYQWDENPTEIKMVGDFNKFSRDLSFVIMVKQPDGTYACSLGNIGGDRMGYQLIGLVKDSSRAVPGTQFDDVISDARGNYVSRLKVRNGTVRIVFDPASLPRGAPEAGVTFDDSSSEVARIAMLDGDIRKRQQEYARASAQFMGPGKNVKDFRYDWSKAVDGLKLQLSGEENPAVRQMLFISLLDLKHMDAEGGDADTARQALAAIPPDSIVWELAPAYLLQESMELAGGLAANESYFQKVVSEHPSREVRALTLERAYSAAMSLQDMSRAKEYYRRLTSEFGDLPPGQRVKSRPPELRIAAGKTMPAFSFSALDDPSKKINDRTLQGKCYLIEFWATWSRPSLAEMESLDRTYARFKKKNFEILSLSFDAGPDDVRKFRTGQWKMPWQHGFLGREALRPGNSISEYFEVSALPKGILVDGHGRIVAVGADLLGSNLEMQVRKLLGD